MTTDHTYEVTVTWTGDRGTGTSGYRAYARDHNVDTAGRPTIAGSSDPSFRGDRTRWNPEQLLVAALAQCHMLWYLHLCADAGVVVTGYVDDATATMTATADGGRFTGATLRPRVTVADDTMIDTALGLHERAHHACYIASSVTFPVATEPTVTAG